MRNHLSLIKLRRELCAAAAVSLLALGTAHAQVKDYSRGFQEFYKLGLPDAAKAEYVNVSAFRDMSDIDGSGLYELQLLGNGWMIEETPKVKGRFIMGNCQVREVYAQEALLKEQQKKWEEIQKTNKTAQVAMMEPWGQDDERTPGQWKKVVARKDIDKTLSFLKKKGEKGERHDSMSYGNAYGALLLSAIHFHRRGFTNEANEVVGLLFQTAGDARKVILQGMDILASSRYGEAHDAFAKKGNWEALDKDLDTLLAKFATSWKMAPAAKRLSERVKQRLAQPQAPPLAGEGLTDEDKALAMELAATNLSARSSYASYGGPGQLWILPLPTPSYRGPGAKPDDQDVMSRIKKRGIKSVPLLLVLLKDDYLTRIDIQLIRGYSGRSYYDSGDTVMDEEMVTQMYDSMHRPASRSDIAFALLESLLPKKEEERQRRQGRMTREELAEECKAWYEANKAKTPMELARMYFQEGSREQQRAGMQYLVKKGADTDLEAIEKHLLDSPANVLDSSAVQEYVQARGEKAKAFIEKYEAKLGEQAAGGDEEMFNDKNFQKMIKQQVKYLKSMTTFNPPKELLAEVVAGTKTIQEISQGLVQGLAKEKPEAALALILDAALQAKDAGTCRELFALAPSTRYLRGIAMGGAIAQDDMAEAEPAKPEPLGIALHAEQWKKLLADTRTLETIGGTTATVGDAAARIIDAMYGQDAAVMTPYSAQPAAFTALGRRTQAIYRARAEALLAGKKGDELPPFPSVGDITDEQKTAAVDKVMKTPDASLAQTVSSLSLTELAALTLAAPKDKKLNAKLAPVGNRVRTVSGDTGLDADLKDLDAAKGKALNKDTAEKLLAVCRKLTVAGKVVRCSAVRGAGLDGIEITVRQIKSESKEYKAMIDSGALGGTDPKADVSGTVADSDCHGSAVWPLEAAGAADAGKKAAAATEDDRLIEAAVADAEAQIKGEIVKDQSGFWKAVDEFCAGKGNVCGIGMIFFVGTPAIKTPPKAEPPKAAAEAKPAVVPATPAKEAPPVPVTVVEPAADAAPAATPK